MAIALVGTPALNIVTSGTTNAVTIASTGAGNLLIAVLHDESGSVTFTMPANWTQVANVQTSPADNTTSLWYLKNCASGITSVTCTRSAASGFPFGAIIAEYSGCDTTAPLDVNASGTGTGTAVAPASMTTLNASDLLVVAGGHDGANTFSAVTSGWTIQKQSATGAGYVFGYADRIVSATGAYAPTLTAAASGPWGSLQASFKAAGGVTSTQTLTSTARITATTSKTLTSTARITATTTKTLTSVARITAKATKALTSTARITATTVRTLTSTVRITVTTQRTLTSVARIQRTTQRTLTSTANIIVTGTTQRTLTSTARITATAARTLTSVARIQQTTLRTLTSVARIITAGGANLPPPSATVAASSPVASAASTAPGATSATSTPTASVQNGTPAATVSSSSPTGERGAY